MQTDAFNSVCSTNRSREHQHHASRDPRRKRHDSPCGGHWGHGFVQQLYCRADIPAPAGGCEVIVMDGSCGQASTVPRSQCGENMRESMRSGCGSFTAERDKLAHAPWPRRFHPARPASAGVAARGRRDAAIGRVCRVAGCVFITAGPMVVKWCVVKYRNCQKAW
jgi:hypothetical protein